MTTTEITRAIINGRFTPEELGQIVDAVKFARSQNARQAARTLRPGQAVRFMGRHGLVVGTLERVKIKNAVVYTSAGRYQVPLSMLEAA